MEAIEFKTKIKNGVIRIPERFKQKNSETVKVIIISEKSSIKVDIIDNLLSNPIKINDFSPLSREEIHERF
ncbi:MAG: hypothetical protein KKD44_19890 [Proteobacteria bacterium]|nr:hypothetical protein [Pseudomonadota bacterium]